MTTLAWLAIAVGGGAAAVFGIDVVRFVLWSLGMWSPEK